MKSRIPILDYKHHDRPSVFSPDGLLREARRQKSLACGRIPEICLLDPDGDLFRHLKKTGARRNLHWACYHTGLFELDEAGESIGVVGCAVGASFAALIAEELFASGCRLLLSVTSAGQILPAGTPPYFVLIDRALQNDATNVRRRKSAHFWLTTEEGKRHRLLFHFCSVKKSILAGAWQLGALYRHRSTP